MPADENTAIPVPLDASIGVFDSGVGGLSVLRAIRKELPDEHLIYVADSANAPYGDHSTAFIEARSIAIAEFLVRRGAKAVVVACNTATVVAAARLRSRFRVPIVAMEPAIKPAVAQTRCGIIGVLATHQTLASESVRRLCTLHGKKVQILLQSCPGWVECVERGDLASSSTQRLVQDSLLPLMEAGVDTLVLGCTHYAFLGETIRQIIGPDVTIIDTANAVAREVARRIANDRRAPTLLSPGYEQFFSTAPPVEAARIMSQLWGKPIDVQSVT